MVSFLCSSGLSPGSPSRAATGPSSKEATGQALAAVQQAGLDALVLNGLATAQLEFSDLGLRPTHQAELLVRPQQRDAAVAILQAQQWRPLWPVPQSGAGYRCQFANPQQARLSLHWFASLDSRWTGADELCWTHSREFRLHQQPAHALSAASALLHTCVRGTKHKGPDSLEWLLDASMLLASHPDLDWPGVLREARYRRQELHLQRALAILQSLSKVTPPPWVVESLQATPASLLARLHFHFNASPPRSWSFLLEPLVEYERTRPPSRPASLLGLLDFLRARWRLRHFWQVPARLIQSLWRRPS